MRKKKKSASKNTQPDESITWMEWISRYLDEETTVTIEAED
jgi:hypothetical protein